jgi:putative flippase GtrA
MSRWLVFNAVGVGGSVVQLAALATLVHVFGVHYLAATILAVESAVLHNFLWHERWTWRDRPALTRRERLVRLVRFHLLNGMVSLVGNLTAMWVLTGVMALPVVPANLAAVIACSLVNFFGSETIVFRGGRRAAGSAAIALFAVTMPLSASAADGLAVELQPATLAAWRAYEQKVEQRFQRLAAPASPFFAQDEYGVKDWRETIRTGGVVMRRVDGPAPGTPSPGIPAGRVHHWIGAVFVPNLTVAEVVRRLQEGAGRESESYADVLASKLLSRSGDSLTVYLKLRRESVLTVVYNTEHAVEYRRLGTTRATNRSVATKIAELADAGTPREHEKPPGSDRGFLWRLNAYWRYEQVDGGVIVECESISLSRGVPVLLRPFISGVVDGIARDALQQTLESVRRVLQK